MTSSAVPRTQALRTALKCLHTLEEIARADTSVRVSDLARTVGISRAAAHQQIVTLVTAGWLEQCDDGSYRLTLRSAQIGQAALRQAGLGERVRPVLERLVSEVREAVSIAVLEQGTATIVQRLEPDRPLQVDIRAEARMPINRSASGLVLIAYASPRELEDLVAQKIELPTEDELRVVREQGYAESTGRWLEGVTAIAAPFFSADGKCAGALSATGPTSHHDSAQVKEPLLKGAGDITDLLSGTPYGGVRHDAAH
jgi:DNA-binding IclR family transcriptional regulator